MDIAVLGLGYVGCVSAACFAKRGHRVTGVDTQTAKVEMINGGRATIVEEGIGELVADVVGSGRLRATTSLADAVEQATVFIVCVGTPSAANGSLSTVALERVSEQLGELIRDKDERVTVVFRSTMLPGTCAGLLIPILEKTSGKSAGVDFGVAVNPEFLREGSSIQDFENPPKTVIGEYDPASGEPLLELYEGLPAEVFRVSIPTAEMTKYVDNSFHALKVGFANEIGAVCRALDVDTDAVTEVFLSDTRLNISRAYLRPGFAFGGSCLPKDLRGIVYAAQRADVTVPLLSSVLPSNEHHLKRAVDEVLRIGVRQVGLLGLAFKSGTDDLRESPLVELAERLIGKGYDLSIYDRDVVLSQLLGTNREFVEARVPHIGKLLAESADEIVADRRVILLGTGEESVVNALQKAGPDTRIIDVIGLRDERIAGRPGYVSLV
ncbi:nucleotide sugar dehydrogenase [Pseudonocardia tropica]|uniref:UDP-glucose 6-dehydrogenase n=1 Tax=Pseudonocardia tropica TaxID=681289 RepID=A0ABV1JXF9_9PSEU